MTVIAASLPDRTQPRRRNFKPQDSYNRRQACRIGSGRSERFYFMTYAMASMVASLPRQKRRRWLARNWRKAMPLVADGLGNYSWKTGSPWLSADSPCALARRYSSVVISYV